MVQDVRRIANTADLDDVDAWWQRVVESIVALIAAGWAVARELADVFLGEHAAIEGREIVPTLAEWSTERVLASLHATGPAAFKTSVAAGNTPTAARASMTNQLAGSSERLVMAGERETVEATIDDSDEIVGWRRVGDGDPCSWCAMLISRGAVYKSAASAGRVVGRAGRTRGNQALGSGYHDNDGCTVEPLYESEEEPTEIADLQDQWDEVTAGKSGKDALNAWRQHWEHRNDDPADRPEPREAAAPKATPTPAPAPKRRDAIRENQDRQQQIDVARIAGDLGADLDRIANLGADLEQLQDQVELAATLALDAFRRPKRDDVEDLAILLRRTAAEAETERDLIDAIWRIARDKGATRIGEPDQVVDFDPLLHELLGSGEPARVEISRPGVRWSDGTVLTRAKVFEAEPAADAVPAPLTAGEALQSTPASITKGANRRPAGISDTDWKAGRQALVEYRGVGFTGTNSQLRNPALRLPHVSARIESMDRVMAASPLQSDVILYRGVADVGKVFGVAADGNMVGAQWTEAAYMSASAKLREARAFAEPGESRAGVMELRVRAGAQGVQLSSLSDQAEILLQRGLAPRVVEDRGIIDGMRYIVVEIP